MPPANLASSFPSDIIIYSMIVITRNLKQNIVSQGGMFTTSVLELASLFKGGWASQGSSMARHLFKTVAVSIVWLATLQLVAVESFLSLC